MLIAVGMYLPFETTFAIFVGGVIKFILDKMTKNVDSPEKRERIDNTGILIASGFIAGEALTGVLLAGLVVLGITSLGGTLLGPLADTIYNSLGGWLSILVFAVVGYLLIFVPKKKAR
jgi:hypothetical protein